ncbi:hypothetical protein F4819DRAFT_487146 [Hypoxylon fuscum]|nr:hypothetical protein F4819DRAFT_487146 [Hypoxylon fuscum]
MSSSSDSGNSSIDVLADEEREDIPTPSTPDDNEYFNDELPHTTTRNMVNRDPKRPLISAASTRKPSAYRAVADLGNYIEECYYKNTSSPRRPIFNKGAGHFTPQLEQNRKNRIIIYPGCFNPPHRNHQALLNRAFSCTQDIHVIAAIVLPLTNDTKSHMTIKFTKAEKARLWTGDYAPHDWLWVYQKSHSEWDEFRTSLARAITTDGFKLQFILLTGSDHVRRDSFPDTWDCENVVVGDVGRKADFVRADGSLARVDGCGSWALLPFNQKNITWKAKDTAEWLLGSLSFTMVGQGYEALVEEIALEYVRRMQGIRVCSYKHDTKPWLRYIPGGDGVAHLSSTDIRWAMTKYPPVELFEKLKRKVLNPEILIQLIQEKNPS